jgi:hypothetical protein
MRKRRMAIVCALASIALVVLVALGSVGIYNRKLIRQGRLGLDKNMSYLTSRYIDNSNVCKTNGNAEVAHHSIVLETR